MYLFVFLWVPWLQERKWQAGPLPLGYIFSAFMVSMMLGSLVYTGIVNHSQRSPNTRGKYTMLILIFARSTHPATAGDSQLTLHAKLSSLICAASALALAIAVSSPYEYTRFWAFCAFEACVGMYYPVQGTLRGTLIANEHRATVRAPPIYVSLCIPVYQLSFLPFAFLRIHQHLSHMHLVLLPFSLPAL